MAVDYLNFWNFLGVHQLNSPPCVISYNNIFDVNDAYENDVGNFACASNRDEFVFVDVNPSFNYFDSSRKDTGDLFSTRADFRLNFLTGKGELLPGRDATTEMIDAFKGSDQLPTELNKLIPQNLRNKYPQIDVNYVASIFYPLAISGKTPPTLRSYLDYLLAASKKLNQSDEFGLITSFLKDWYGHLQSQQENELARYTLSRISFVLIYLNIHGYEKPFLEAMNSRYFIKYNEKYNENSFPDSKSKSLAEIRRQGDIDLFWDVLSVNSQFTENVSYSDLPVENDIGIVSVDNNFNEQTKLLRSLIKRFKNNEQIPIKDRIKYGTDFYTYGSQRINLTDDEVRLLWKSGIISQFAFFETALPMDRGFSKGARLIFNVNPDLLPEFFGDIIWKYKTTGLFDNINKIIYEKIIPDEQIVAAFGGDLGLYLDMIFEDPFSMHELDGQKLRYLRDLSFQIDPNEHPYRDKFFFAQFAYKYLSYQFEMSSEYSGVVEAYEAEIGLPNPFENTGNLFGSGEDKNKIIDHELTNITQRYFGYVRGYFSSFSVTQDETYYWDFGPHYNPDNSSELFPYRIDFAFALGNLNKDLLEDAVNRFNRDILLPNGFAVVLQKLPGTDAQAFNYILLPVKVEKVETVNSHGREVPIYTVSDAREQLPEFNKYVTDEKLIPNGYGYQRSETYFAEDDPTQPLWILLSKENAQNAINLYAKFLRSSPHQAKTAFPQLFASVRQKNEEELLADKIENIKVHEKGHLEASFKEYPHSEVYSVLSEFAESPDPFEPLLQYSVAYLTKDADGIVRLKTGQTAEGEKYDSANDEYGMGFMWFLAYAALDYDLITPQESLVEIARTDPTRFTLVINELDAIFAGKFAWTMRRMGAGARDSYIEMYGS